jgi:L-arabinose isomerase
LIDMGNRFRLIVDEVDVVKPPHAMPKLPVASAMWKAKPDFETACTAWILAGGAHHSAFSQAVTTEMLEDFATIAGIEFLPIDADTKIRDFKQTLRTNEVYYALAKGWAI